KPEPPPSLRVPTFTFCRLSRHPSFLTSTPAIGPQKPLIRKCGSAAAFALVSSRISYASRCHQPRERESLVISLTPLPCLSTQDYHTIPSVASYRPHGF